MKDLLGHPIHPGPFTTMIQDGITGTVSELGEDRYLEPTQRETGWPAIHLLPFRWSTNWDPQKVRAFVPEWLQWSLPPGCDCAKHWEKTIAAFPLADSVLASPESFFEWTVNVHNHVNERLGKHQAPLAPAREIWSRIAAAGPVAWFRPVNDNVKGGDRLVITIATGKAREWLRYTEGPMRAYAAACGADFVVLKNTTQGWWGLEKFRVHEYAKAYDETLYIDADVLVTVQAKSMFDYTCDPIAIFDETSSLPSRQWVQPAWDQVLSCREDRKYRGLYGRSFNSGIVFCTRLAADVWEPPKLPIPTIHVGEQITVGINLNNSASQIDYLPTRCNLQIWHPQFDDLLPYAEFVHLSGIDRKTEQLKEIIDRLDSIGNPILKQDV